VPIRTEAIVFTGTTRGGGRLAGDSGWIAMNCL
jgi:hypothetical protein